MASSLRYLVLGLAGAASLAVTAQAAPVLITGGLYFPSNSSVTPSTNYFDAANGYVPSTAGNAASTTVAIGAPTEFLYSDRQNTDGADFTGNSLTISDYTVNGAYDFVMTFSANQSHFFDNAVLLPNNFGGRISVTGNTLTFTSPDTIYSGSAARFATITFLGNGASAPEPATWAMMILGFGLVGAAMRGSRKVTTRIACAT